MRKVILWSRYLLLASFLFLYSCKKNSEEVKTDDVSKTEVAAKVTAWLETKKSVNPELNQKIQTLMNSLEISKLSLESYKDGEKLVVIPITKSLKLRNNKGKNPINMLLLILNKAGAISKGNIVQYIPEGTQTQPIPINTFSKLFTYQKLDIDGAFTILTITDWYVYAVKFKDGKLASVSEMKKKSKSENQRSNVENNCIDWFLVTTYYYADGSTSTTEQYVGRTCNDNTGGCGYYDPNVQSEDCDDGYSGGGSGGGDIGYEYEMIKESVDWNVALNPNGSSGEIKSIEKIKGKRVAGEPQGGHFTSISHKWSACNFCSNANPNNVWSEQSYSVTKTDQQATSSVSGRLQYNGDITFPSNSKSWSFQEIFP